LEDQNSLQTIRNIFAVVLYPMLCYESHEDVAHSRKKMNGKL